MEILLKMILSQWIFDQNHRRFRF